MNSGSPNRFAVYKPSGRVGVATLPLAIVGLLIAVGLAYVYQLLLNWIPLIYINGLATFGVGVALGTVSAVIVSTGKIRSTWVAIALGIALTLTTLGTKYYFQYLSMVHFAVGEIMQQGGVPKSQRQAVRDFVRRDLTFSKHIQLRVEQGWNVGRGGRNGLPINGPLVYLVWLLEAGIVFYFGVKMPYAAAREPYSEKLGDWASEVEVVMTLPIDGDAMVTQIRSATTVDELLELPIPKTDQVNQFAVYRVNSIPGQEMEDAYLTVVLTTVTVDREGQQHIHQSTLVRHAILSTGQRAQLVENAGLLAEAIAEYRKAMEAEAATADTSDADDPGNEDDSQEASEGQS